MSTEAPLKAPLECLFCRGKYVIKEYQALGHLIRNGELHRNDQNRLAVGGVEENGPEIQMRRGQSLEEAARPAISDWHRQHGRY